MLHPIFFWTCFSVSPSAAAAATAAAVRQTSHANGVGTQTGTKRKEKSEAECKGNKKDGLRHTSRPIRLVQHSASEHSIDWQDVVDASATKTRPFPWHV